MTARLLTIPFSHYCEKARWAADYQGFAYREEKYLPGAHLVPVRRSHGRTLPILVTETTTLKDSTDILQYLDARAPSSVRLYPSDPTERREVDALEELFDARLGRATRLYAYHHGLPFPDSLCRVMAPSMSSLQRFAFRVALPLLGPQIRRRYRIDDASASSAAATIHEIFAEVSTRLDGKQYLVGNRFSAADLTFAALAAPSIMPPGHPAYASDLDREPPGLRAWAQSLRATPAGAHVLRMYREHRLAATAAAA